MSDVTVPLSGVGVSTSIGSVMLTIKNCGSVLYTQASKRLAAEASTLDNFETWSKLGRAEKDERDASVIDTTLAAVVTAYSAIEAAINELFLETAWFPPLDDNTAKGLRAGWPEVEYKCVQDKANRAFELLKISPPAHWWGKGAPQQFGGLQDLRNELLHHAPYTYHGGTVDELEKRLSPTFGRAHIWRERNPSYRWAACLGGPCAEWAVRTSVTFQAEFFALVGCDYPSAKA